MVNNVRIAGLVVAGASLLLFGGCGDDKDDKQAKGTIKPPVLSADIKLTADEKSGGFDKRTATAKPGTVKITVENPSESKGKHGVGIDGGVYKNIPGAIAKPGGRVSLTVDLKEGKYEIFDPHQKNRDAGYEVKLTVKK